MIISINARTQHAQCLRAPGHLVNHLAVGAPQGFRDVPGLLVLQLFCLFLLCNLRRLIDDGGVLQQLAPVGGLLARVQHRLDLHQPFAELRGAPVKNQQFFRHKIEIA